jgi:hypothetical protein
MDKEMLAIIAGGVVVFGILVAIIMVATRKPKGGKPAKPTQKDQAFNQVATEEVNHLFTKEFREELRNHGRLKFENIINENAMFLEQDLNLTIAQLNEYMKKEITNSLNKEFQSYAKGMQEAQELALGALQKTASEIDAQRAQLTEALKAEVANQEAAMIAVYEQNMAQIIEHYLLEALGDQLDLKAQLPFIISQMEANKDQIIEDMRA